MPWAAESGATCAGAAAETGADLPAGLGREVRLPADVDWEAVTADHGFTRSCAPDDVSECVLVEGNGLHVLVIGDSQAQMLGPMFERIAEEHDLTLSVNIVAGCPWQEGLTNRKSSAASDEECEASRVGWYDEALPQLDPDVVIMVSRPRDESSWRGTIVRRDGKEQSLFAAMADTSDDTLAKVRATGARAVLVERMIMPETFEPTDCLTSAARPSECAVPVPLEKSPTDAFYISRAREEAQLDTIDLNRAFCPGAPLCQPVVNGEVVWRDNHHVTATYAEARREQVWRILEASGVLSARG